MSRYDIILKKPAPEKPKEPIVVDRLILNGQEVHREYPGFEIIAFERQVGEETLYMLDAQGRSNRLAQEHRQLVSTVLAKAAEFIKSSNYQNPQNHSTVLRAELVVKQ